MSRRFKKDYYNKQYQNPFFKKRKEEKSGLRQLRSRFSNCFLIFIIMGWFIFLFFSPYFRIENINFGDTDRDLEKKIKLLLNAEFEKKKLIIFNNQNYFVFNSNSLKDQLGAIFLLNELRIEKKFPNTLFIKAKEKSDVLVIIDNENAFFVDRHGLVVDMVPENFKTFIIDTEQKATTTTDFITINPAKIELADEITRKMPVVYAGNIDKVYIRDKVFDEKFINLLLDIHHNLLNKLGVSLKIFKIEENKIRVETRDGWEIYFLKDDTINTQLENLKIILLEKIGNSRNLLEYIDLRFGDKIYYKSAGS